MTEFRHRERILFVDGPLTDAQWRAICWMLGRRDRADEPRPARLHTELTGEPGAHGVLAYLRGLGVPHHVHDVYRWPAQVHDTAPHRSGLLARRSRRRGRRRRG